jgi:hypothetical protein
LQEKAAQAAIEILTADGTANRVGRW